jgi:hypothetical protein
MGEGPTLQMLAASNAKAPPGTAAPLPAIRARPSPA